MLKKGKNERNLKVTIEELKGIKNGFSVILENLKEKIEKLKNERAEVMEEIEALKREGIRRKGSLENELAFLREEVRDLKKTLGESGLQHHNESRSHLFYTD